MKRVMKKILPYTAIMLLFLCIPQNLSEAEASSNWWNTQTETNNACRYLVKDLGFTKYAAAGILGNLKHESNMNPYIRERVGNHVTYPLGTWLADMLDPDNNGFGPGWGLAQWGDGSGRGGLGSGRWIQLLNYVNTKYGTQYTSFYADGYSYNRPNDEQSLKANIPNLYQQLDFIKYEMRQGSGYVSQNELNKMRSTDETSDAVLYRYEFAGTNTRDKRRQNASEIYSQYCSNIDANNYSYSFSNSGYLDELSVEGNLLNVKGWHASVKATDKNKRYMFIMDAVKGTEIKRLSLSSEKRQDVASVFPEVASASMSGFNVKIPITKDMRGKQISIITRYSVKSNADESLDSLWFNNKILIPNDAQNQGLIENFSLDGEKIKIKGWHVSTKANEKTKRYMFIMDAVTGREIKRLQISNKNRSDISEKFPDVITARTSGFDIDVPITDELRGKTLFIVTRYLVSSNADEALDDIWFRTNNVVVPNIQHLNRGYIEKFSVSDNQINVRGWHVSTKTNEKTKRYMFIMDAVTGREIKRLQIASENRPDLAKEFPNVASAQSGGFNVSLPITDELRGKTLFVVTRYLVSSNADEALDDIWFRTNNVIVPNIQHQNCGYIDNLTVSNNILNVKGWHASTKANNKTKRYMFVMDAATGREIKRISISNEIRSDVAKAYSSINSAQSSGFNVNIPITKDMKGKTIYIVTRYLPNTNADETLDDIWFRWNNVSIPKG